MRYLLILLALVVALSPLHSDAGDISAASRSVVRIAMYSSAEGQRELVGHASGIVVAPDKVLTNAHVTEEAEFDESFTFVVVPSQGKGSYEAKIIDTAREKDLALLQLSGGAKLTPATLFTGTVGDGADVFAIGYPANVDVALDASEADMLRAQPPVKTRGTVSAGRSSKRMDSLLHTAPIAPGNSGGPLVDPCGRVVGINSFGSVADGGGSEFYFAVSVKEIRAFLARDHIPLRVTDGACLSAAEVSRAEAERQAKANAKIEAEARLAEELKGTRESQARRAAEYEIIGSRENHLALAGLLILLSIGAGGAAWQFAERTKNREMQGSIGMAALLLAGSLFAYYTRPSFEEIEPRMREILKAGSTAPEPAEAAASTASSGAAGNLLCTIQRDRSRITISDTADVRFSWTDKGCVNGRTQYAENAGRWSRAIVSGTEDQASMVSYTPGSSTYRVERYLLGADAIAKVRTAKAQSDVKGCSTDAAVTRKVTTMNTAVRDALSGEPQELLVYSCKAQ